MSDTNTRSLVKTISWRITGSLSTFIISYIISSYDSTFNLLSDDTIKEYMKQTQYMENTYDNNIKYFIEEFYNKLKTVYDDYTPPIEKLVLYIDKSLNGIVTQAYFKNPIISYLTEDDLYLLSSICDNHVDEFFNLLNSIIDDYNRQKHYMLKYLYNMLIYLGTNRIRVQVDIYSTVYLSKNIQERNITDLLAL